MAEYDFTTCGACGDKIQYSPDAVHDCWVRRKIDTQDYLPEPLPTDVVPLGE